MLEQTLEEVGRSVLLEVLPALIGRAGEGIRVVEHALDFPGQIAWISGSEGDPAGADRIGEAAAIRPDDPASAGSAFKRDDAKGLLPA